MEFGYKYPFKGEPYEMKYIRLVIQYTNTLFLSTEFFRVLANWVLDRFFLKLEIKLCRSFVSHFFLSLFKLFFQIPHGFGCSFFKIVFVGFSENPRPRGT